MDQSKRDYTLKLSLFLWGFNCLPESITEQLGVSPTRSWEKGKIRRPGASPAKFNTWILESPLNPDNSTPSKQLAALKTLLPDDRSVFRALPPETSITVTCHVYAYSYWPNMPFTPQDLAYLVELNAELEFDLYDLIGV